MTLNEFFDSSYQWGDQNAQFILLLSVAIPAVGTLLAWIGKGGKTDEDGRFIASALLGFAMLAVVLEAMALYVGVSMRGVSVMDVNVALLAAPIICLFCAMIGLRMVFRLAEIGVVRALADLHLRLAVHLWPAVGGGDLLPPPTVPAGSWAGPGAQGPPGPRPLRFQVAPA